MKEVACVIVAAIVIAKFANIRKTEDVLWRHRILQSERAGARWESRTTSSQFLLLTDTR
jgi:hypothetical protein